MKKANVERLNWKCLIRRDVWSTWVQNELHGVEELIKLSVDDQSQEEDSKVEISTVLSPPLNL